nr:hypothetical protein [Pandoravirus massiliensis]
MWRMFVSIRVCARTRVKKGEQGGLVFFFCYMKKKRKKWAVHKSQSGSFSFKDGPLVTAQGQQPGCRLFVRWSQHGRGKGYAQARSPPRFSFFLWRVFGRMCAPTGGILVCAFGGKKRGTFVVYPFLLLAYAVGRRSLARKIPSTVSELSKGTKESHTQSTDRPKSVCPCCFVCLKVQAYGG